MALTDSHANIWTSVLNQDPTPEFKSFFPPWLLSPPLQTPHPVSPCPPSCIGGPLVFAGWFHPLLLFLSRCGGGPALFSGFSESYCAFSLSACFSHLFSFACMPTSLECPSLPSIFPGLYLCPRVSSCGHPFPFYLPLLLGEEGASSERQASVCRASTFPHVVGHGMVWALVEGTKHGEHSSCVVPRNLRRVGIVQQGTGVCNLHAPHPCCLA